MIDKNSQCCPDFKHHQHKHMKLLFPVFFIALLLGGVRFMSWDKVNWGKVEMLPGSAITVTGQSKQDIKNQIANFSAGVTAEFDDKQTATDEVNQKMTELTKVVKDFGIEDKDIKTQNISVHQYEERPARSGIKKWRASNNISITLRDIDKASQLADLLNTTGATNIHGPNFALDDTQQAEVDLMKSAIDNAREKAQAIATASNRKLGKVLTVQEGAQANIPVFRAMEMAVGGGAVPTPVEPGTGTVRKTVTVVFELN